MKQLKQIIQVSVLILAAVFMSTMVFSSENQVANGVKFDHSIHVTDNEMACSDCHKGVENLSTGQRAIPDHDVCSECHEVEDGDCGVCHTTPDDPFGVPPVGANYLLFGHNKHIVNGLQCSQCHGNPGSPALPSQAECHVCHSADFQPLDCKTCHSDQIPSPNDHKLVTWNQDHGLDASMATSDCSMCHAQSSCDECHQGENLYGSPHPPTWRFNHFAETSYGAECLTCHETRETCTECHRATQPIPHALGPEWANKNNGGDHKEQAESFIESCLSCHDVGEDDPTCAKCHE